MKQHEITIFICEDEETKKEIIQKFFDKNKITYANILSADLREKIVKAIEELENEELEKLK